MAAQNNDWGFAGPQYVAPNPYQDSQVLINWYPEIDPNKTAKTVIALLGCPGLVQVATVQGL
jgi:hypothetical protein